MTRAAGDSPLRTLILGGYGNFGARIARALAGDDAIALVLGGRDRERAQAFARTLNCAALAVDLEAPDLAQRLRDEGIGLVIHTAGPFQQQDYAVAHQCSAAGAHYIDLADARRFVCDFEAATQAAFAAAGCCGISGASTVPALSSAVVEHLTRDWQDIGTIDICVAPAQSAPRGVATMAAVLSYCGAPVNVWHGGRWQAMPGWAAPRPVRFARMRPRRGALCDIPDLELFPARYGVGTRVMFRAALEVPLSQSAFAWLAGLRRYGLLRRPQALARLLHRGAPLLDRWGSQLGGMYVEVTGHDAAGRPAQARWDVAAGNDHGPEIPAMAAILLARRLARGKGPEPGAFTATGLLTLAEFQCEFERWGMVVDLA